MHEARRGGGVAAQGGRVFVEPEHLAATTRCGRARRSRGEARTESAPKDPRDKRIAQLKRETRRLERKLEQAETVIGIQKKVASLLGIPLKSPDDEEND